MLIIAYIRQSRGDNNSRVCNIHMSDDNDYNKKEQLTTVSSSSRYRILSLIDNFIEQIFQIRKTLFGVSISALVLAPIAIGLSVFLLQHPSFFAILDIENEFGDVLAVLLGTIIVISSIWFVFHMVCNRNQAIPTNWLLEQEIWRVYERKTRNG